MEAIETRGKAERLGGVFRRALSVVVRDLPVSRYLEDRGVKVRDVGMRKIALCPLHEEKSPSFTIYGDSSWYCFGCCEYGDVVSLHARLDNHSQQWTAMVDLSMRYGIELPRRSETWHRWQAEKTQIRELAERVRFETRCRRLFKLLVLNAPEIEQIEDSAERRAELERCWREFNRGLREVAR